MGDDQARTHVRLAKYFLAQMPDHCKSQADCNGKSAFHYAVESKRTEILEIMEQEGLSIYKKDSAHRGVLHEAARLNKLGAVKRVIAIAGEEKLGAQDINGRTPFLLAEDYDAHQVIKYLRATYGIVPRGARETKAASKTRSLTLSSRKYPDGGKQGQNFVSQWLKPNLLRIAALFDVMLLAVIIFICTCRAIASCFQI